IRIWHLVFCCTLLYSFSTAQEAPRKGTVVPSNILANFPHANNPQLTVIDFFGTWCAPCIKALPHLQELKQKFNDSITI
ncbi:thioredoxin domain-containing protein, partial [Acinetobacter baumannii]